MGCHSGELERQVGSIQLAKIAVIVKSDKVRVIHDRRRNRTNCKVQLKERHVLLRLKHIVEGVMKLMAGKSNEEGIEFLTLDFRDAFKQLHVTESERRYMVFDRFSNERFLRAQHGFIRHRVWTWYGVASLKRG